MTQIAHRQKPVQSGGARPGRGQPGPPARVAGPERRTGPDSVRPVRPGPAASLAGAAVGAEERDARRDVVVAVALRLQPRAGGRPRPGRDGPAGRSGAAKRAGGRGGGRLRACSAWGGVEQRQREAPG